VRAGRARHPGDAAGDARPEFLAKNPNGRIPLLELDDGTFLPESNAILCYLAEGTRLWPESAVERAQVLSWMFFEQYSHEPYIAVMKFWKFWGGLHRKRPEEIALWEERGQAALRVMDEHLRARVLRGRPLHDRRHRPPRVHAHRPARRLRPRRAAGCAPLARPRGSPAGPRPDRQRPGLVRLRQRVRETGTVSGSWVLQTSMDCILKT
jgi:hypothetical protein